MTNYASLHINLLISNTFRYAGFVEKFGTGIPKIINACCSGDNPEPEDNVYEKSISVIFKASEKYLLLVQGLYKGKSDNIMTKSFQDVGDNVGANVGANIEDPSNSRYRRKSIVELIKINPKISAKEIALILNVSDRTIERDLDWLKRNRMIFREGDAKGGWWIILT